MGNSRWSIVEGKWPPFVRGLVVWQISAAVGSLATVVIWSLLGFNDLGGLVPLTAMCWLLSSICSTPLALLMFVMAQTASTRPPHHLRKRILRTHDLGAIATMAILYLTMVPKEFTWDAGGEALVIGIVYPIVGTVAWRKSLGF